MRLEYVNGYWTLTFGQVSVMLEALSAPFVETRLQTLASQSEGWTPRERYLARGDLSECLGCGIYSVNTDIYITYPHAR